MKILHIANRYYEGFGYQENIMPRYQKKLGHDVVVVVSSYRKREFIGFLTESNNKDREEYMDDNVKIIRIPIRGEFKGRFVVFTNLNNILEMEKPDYIYHYGLTAPSLLTAIKYKQKHPSVFLVADCHADWNNSARNKLWKIGYYNIFWAKSLKNYMKYLDLVFGVTPARCYFAHEELGIPWELIRLLPLGADEDIVKDVSVKSSKNKRLGDRLIAVTGGKFDRSKGLDILLEAASGLDLELKIFGMLSEDLKEKINKMAGDNISLYGWQNREGTINLLLESDIAIWNKRHTTLIEDAIATLTPVILRYHGSTCHHIRGNGFYIFSDNSIEIRQYFELLIKNRSVLSEMRKEATKILDLISYNRIAKESIEYYYDRSPKYTHQIIMNDPLCQPSNRNFRRLY